MNKKQLIEEIKETNNYLTIVEEMATDLIHNVEELDLEEIYTVRFYICRIVLGKTNKINKIIQSEIMGNDELKGDMQYIYTSIKEHMGKYNYILLPNLNKERLQKIIKEIKQLKKGYDY